MKKKILAAALCICTIFSMSACGKKDSGNKGNVEGKLTLGSYKGYTVGESAAEASEEDVQKYIESILKIYQTTEDVTEGTTAEGDTINVTYHRTVSGEEYTDSQTKVNEDGTVEGNTENVKLNPDSYIIEGFTEGLTGKNIGETVEMDLVFPEDYNDTDVAGQEVHYSVLINCIKETVIPEFTDEFVSEHYAFAGFGTAEDFREFIRQEIRYININNMIWEDILEAQKVESYPSEELADYVDKTISQYTSMISAYGYSMDAYYQALGKTEDEFKKEIEDRCKEIVKEKMFVRAVADAEGIKYTDEAAAKYAAISGFASVDEFSEQLEAYGEELNYSVISYLVQNFVCENAKIVSDEETTAGEDETPEETAAGEGETPEETSPEETSPEDETPNEADSEETSENQE